MLLACLGNFDLSTINISFKIGNYRTYTFGRSGNSPLANFHISILSLTKSSASALLSDFMVAAHWSLTPSDNMDVMLLNLRLKKLCSSLVSWCHGRE